MAVDMVDRPPHYNASSLECIDAIEAITGDGFEYYLQGNILKYLWRYRYKNGKEDLSTRRRSGCRSGSLFTACSAHGH